MYAIIISEYLRHCLVITRTKCNQKKKKLVNSSNRNQWKQKAMLPAIDQINFDQLFYWFRQRVVKLNIGKHHHRITENNLWNESLEWWMKGGTGMLKESAISFKMKFCFASPMHPKKKKKKLIDIEEQFIVFICKWWLGYLKCHAFASYRSAVACSMRLSIWQWYGVAME